MRGGTMNQWPSACYDASCRKCGRLARFLDEVKAEHADYFCKPVPPFGAAGAELLVIGLAPGKHGANATGRPFTGDHAGRLLYKALFAFGFASRPISVSADDGLTLANCRITNAVKCLPPQNKPLGSEEKNCNPFLQKEISGPGVRILLALGLLAHRAVLRALGVKPGDYPFGHNTWHELDNGMMLVNSYHCSRYNTQTRRLTEAMFFEVFEGIAQKLEESPCDRPL